MWNASWRLTLVALLLISFSSSLLGCERRYLSDGAAPGELSCSSCHGSEQNSAPPKALNGSSDPTEVGVGAHQEHMLAGKVSKPVACQECHPVPEDWSDDRHPNLVTDMQFGTLAKTSGAAPAWDEAGAQCQNTYCHGATLAGAASRPWPVWTQPDGTQLACTSCHGNPPRDSSHESHVFLRCNGCHASVIGSSGALDDLQLHVDGEVEVTMPSGGTWDRARKSCAATGTSCHGSGSISW